jgi:hypothetical protein
LEKCFKYQKEQIACYLTNSYLWGKYIEDQYLPFFHFFGTPGFFKKKKKKKCGTLRGGEEFGHPRGQDEGYKQVPPSQVITQKKGCYVSGCIGCIQDWPATVADEAFMQKGW